MTAPLPDRPQSPSPSVRLAHCPGAQGDNCLIGKKGVPQIPREKWPALLVSYVYLRGFIGHQSKFAYRDWALDSGAFSAKNSGTEVDLGEYIETAKRLLAEDPSLSEVFSLDVIGDWRGGLRNCETMWKAGVPAIPTYHIGEPESVLLTIAKEFPKIALGGVAGIRNPRQKVRWARECFNRVWPKRIHGFGMASQELLLSLPWDSVDATSWELTPCGFGGWKMFTRGLGSASRKIHRVDLRGSEQNLRGEVEWYLDLERMAKSKWSKTLAALPPAQTRGATARPDLRLVIVNPAGVARHRALYTDEARAEDDAVLKAGGRKKKGRKA